MFENINNFIVDFMMKNIGNENVINIWTSEKNQKLFSKIIKKDSVCMKDPNKPKRGKSGYLFFCQEYRSLLKKEYPDMSIKDIVSKLGIIWKELKETNPDEIERFEAMSRYDRDRYKTEILEYNIKLKNNKKTSQKKTKSKNKGYDKFIKTKSKKTKKTHPELDTVGVIHYLTQKWEKYPEDKKEKYSKK